MLLIHLEYLPPQRLVVVAGEEVVHAAVVVHPLHEVAHELGVEERHRQFQQFDKEIAHQRDIDAHGDMQQQPSADEVDGRTAEGKHQLTEQYQPNEAKVLVLDAHVDDGLREEWQDELQQTAQKHSYTLLFPVRPRADPMTLELLKTIFY